MEVKHPVVLCANESRDGGRGRSREHGRAVASDDFEVVQEPLAAVHLFRDVRFEVAGERRADIIVLGSDSARSRAVSINGTLARMMQ